MKKTVVSLLAALSLFALVGCNNNPNTAQLPEDIDRNSAQEWGEQIRERTEYDIERAKDQLTDNENNTQNQENLTRGASGWNGNDGPAELDKATQDALINAEITAKNNH